MYVATSIRLSHQAADGRYYVRRRESGTKMESDWDDNLLTEVFAVSRHRQQSRRWEAEQALGSRVGVGKQGMWAAGRYRMDRDRRRTRTCSARLSAQPRRLSTERCVSRRRLQGRRSGEMPSTDCNE